MSGIDVLAPGAVVLRGFVLDQATELLAEVERVAAAAPFRNFVTRGNRRMSVAMTNCGALGWISDRAGYRYSETDPDTGRSWPAMPSRFAELASCAAAAAGFPGFRCDACLVNRYVPGNRLALHQDRDEQDFSQPIVSVSLGLAARFLFGGPTRDVRPRRVLLEHGDIVVFGGAARLFHHGVAPLGAGGPDAESACRINLTLRRAH